MKSMMRILVCCLLLSAGCRSTNLFSRFSKQAASEKDVAQSEAGLPSPGRRAVENRSSLAQTDFPDTTPASQRSTADSLISEHIQLGRQEVAAWYGDPRMVHLKAAEDHFARELLQNPQNPDAHHGLAIVADLQKNFTKAEAHYQQAIALRPTDARILGDMGYSYLLQNRIAECEEYLNRALVHDPNNQNAIKHLGDVYARKGDVELARSTYRRVLNESEIKQALAENVPAGDDRSLIDRLRNKPTAEQGIVADLQRGFDERRQAERQQQQTAARPFPVREPTGDQIRDQLSSIDNERYRHVADGPIMLGGPSEPIQRLPQGSYSSGPQNQGNMPMDNMSVNLTQNGSGQQPYPAVNSQSQFEQGRSNNAFAPGTNALANNQNALASQAALNAFAPQSQPMIQPGGSYVQRDPALDQLTRPWGQGVEPAAGTQTQTGVGPAFYEQQGSGTAQATQANNFQGGPTPTDYGDPRAASPYMNQNGMNQNGASPAAPSNATADPFAQMPSYGSNGAGQGQFSQTGQATGNDNGYQDARRAAAQMGMGFGPGNMFPMFQNSVPTMMPGSNSMLNGAAVPAPQRHLPGDPQPIDLSTQMHAPPVDYAPLQNQMGHAIPTGTPHMSQPRQIGSPQQYNAGSEQSYGGYSNSQPDRYEQQRLQAAGDLNYSAQQNGGRQIQYAPTSNDPGVGFAGGQLIHSPQGSQYTLPSPVAQPQSFNNGTSQPTGNQPPPYPYTSRNSETYGQAPVINNNSNAPPNYTGNVVVPESYQGRMNSEFSQPTTNGTPARGSFNSGSGLPAIVPGN